MTLFRIEGTFPADDIDDAIVELARHFAAVYAARHEPGKEFAECAVCGDDWRPQDPFDPSTSIVLIFADPDEPDAAPDAAPAPPGGSDT